MNLLFLTQNLLDANFTLDELAKEIPGLHVDVSPDVQDAIRQLAVPGRYRAVLLDSGFHDSDSLAAIKALRAGNSRIAVVALLEPADLNSGITLMGAGADDYVVKHPGFIATLPGVLQHACGPYEPFRKLELKAAPVRRDTTGATSVLLRNIAGSNTSSHGSSEVIQNGERGSGDVADSNSTGRKLEIRIRDLEGQRGALLRAITDSSENQLHLKEEFSTALTQWEKERRDWDQRLKNAEHQRQILEGTLRETSGNSQTIDEFRAAARAVKAQLGELESKNRSLEENLRSAQTSLAEQAKVLQSEREQHSVETEGLRNQLSLLEQQRMTLESALFSEEELQKKSDERHVAEMQRWRRQQDEWEQQQHLAVEERSRMQEAMQALQVELANRTEELRAANEQWELRQEAWNQRLDKVEESFTKIEQALLDQKTHQEQLTVQFGADLAKAEDARRDLEHELRRADTERTRQQESLRAAETRIGELSEQLRIEREQWESMRLTSEQQRDALEAKVVQLETIRDELAKGHSDSLAQAEKSRLEWENRATALAEELRLLTNEHNHTIERQESERGQWKSISYELEQRKMALEEELSLAKQSIQKLVKEEEAYRSRWETSLSELEQLRLDAGSAHALAREAADRYLLQLTKLRELHGASSGS